MYVSYVKKNIENNNSIQILNCRPNKETLWKVMLETALKYKDEISQKENFNDLQLVENKEDDSITIKGVVSNTIKGLLWNSTENVDIVILFFKIQETNDTVHINKNLNHSLYSELQNKLNERRRKINPID